MSLRCRTQMILERSYRKQRDLKGTRYRLLARNNKGTDREAVRLFTLRDQ